MCQTDSHSERSGAARLRAALRDPATLIADEPAARAAHVLRSHALKTIDEAIATASAAVAVVKGAALALTVYPRPWLRQMCDIDLLVLPEHRTRVLAALMEAGGEQRPVPVGRPWSVRALGETPLVVSFGGAGLDVELHTQLDKVVSRPVSYAEVLHRSRPLPEQAFLRCPCTEDHALLVALHAATSGYHHPVGLVDLELLFRMGLDLATLERRADRWKLRTALYVALRAAQAHGAPSIPASFVARLQPSAMRRRAVGWFYEPEGYPTARRPLRLGWPWLLEQVPLREDTAHFALGVCAYGAVRLMERTLQRLLPRGRLAE